MTAQTFLDGKVTLHCGDCLDVLDAMDENSVDSVACDPPYHLHSIVKRFGATDAVEPRAGATGAFKRASSGFMGKKWDGGDVAFRVETWAKVLRVLKPGGYMVAFSSSRTFGRMSVAIEDAGFITHPMFDFFARSSKGTDFWDMLDYDQQRALARLFMDVEIGGMLAWVFGSGFPKAHRVHAEGYEGFRYGGQATKPAVEPIYIGQKPFSEQNGTANILRWGTGAVNIKGCRVAGGEDTARQSGTNQGVYGRDDRANIRGGGTGRWPANVIHDGSAEVIAAFPMAEGGGNNHKRSSPKTDGVYGEFAGDDDRYSGYDDKGSAARFFYTAKADAEDRIGSKHPTVKPLDLIQYLVRLVTPPGGIVLDPFAGTGTTGEAALREGMRAVLIEREPEYQADIARRMELAANPTKRTAVAKSKNNLQGAEGTPLFGGEAA